MEKKHRSKRTYPERDCENPNCGFEQRFIPHDRRQKFCIEQCRINFHNDQKHNDNTTIFKNEKNLREFDKRLAKIYKAFVDKDGYCVVWKGIFNYEQINVALLVTEQQNPRTGGKVKWFYKFGTELHPKDANYFIIHKKQTK